MQSLRSGALLPLLTACAVAGGAPSDSTPGLALASRIAAADQHRDSMVAEVVSLRRYTLHNPRWKTDATADVRVTWDVRAGTKRFEIQRSNAEGLQKEVIKRILQGEIEAVRDKNASFGISPANYAVQPGGMQVINGRPCETVVLRPKKSSRYLLDGRACIDTQDAAVVHIEGRTAKSVSFWVGKPYITLDFRRVGDFWFSARNRSVADVKFLGQTTLTIDYLDYSVTPVSGPLLLACTSGPCSPGRF